MTRESAADLRKGDRVLVFDGTVEGEWATVVHATERGGVKVERDDREWWLPFNQVEHAR